MHRTQSEKIGRGSRAIRWSTIGRSHDRGCKLSSCTVAAPSPAPSGPAAKGRPVGHKIASGGQPPPCARTEAETLEGAIRSRDDLIAILDEPARTRTPPKAVPVEAAVH